MKSRHSHGFTLIEIMLVMIILATLTGVVVTNMGAGYQTIALESDVAVLTDVIMSAQRAAQAKRVIVRLTFDIHRNEYYLSSSSSLRRHFEPLEGSLGDTVELNTGIAFNNIQKVGRNVGDIYSIHFFPDGTSEPAHITIGNKAGEEEVLEVTSLSGLPKRD